MISDKPSVQLLIKTLKERNISEIVISPGARNAPLIISFASDSFFNCINVVDERSAAFIALGISQKKNIPVVICCTSGSAPLNYSPAIAEAFYSKTPLIVVSADRPSEWIDQRDNQTIKQLGVFTNFVRAEMNLEENLSDYNSFWHMHRLLSDTLNKALYINPGPVHINCPFSEPVYNQKAETDIPEFPYTRVFEASHELSLEQVEQVGGVVNDCDRILILIGRGNYPKELEKTLDQFVARHNGVVILNEGLNNLQLCSGIDQIDLMITKVQDDHLEEFAPKLLITIGDIIVSKNIKKFLRQNKPQFHWRIDPCGELVDTYQRLDNLFCMNALEFFDSILPLCGFDDSNYQNLWTELSAQCKSRFLKTCQSISWSDFAAMNILLMQIPEHTDLHLGNSSIVRNALLFENIQRLKFSSNRGTSGIDGSLSTAVGIALSTTEIVTIIVGDLSFLYDSNALWINSLPKNLKIVVINNFGGNIFKFISGPETTDQYNEYFISEHKIKVAPIAEAYGVKTFKASNQHELLIVLQEFYQYDKSCTLLEINTANIDNGKIWREAIK
ncbi:MAG: 2-succinyl-5-enolpyruvyl-6-hydroxy-3-cyclohexene-1-carboxylic-acid synthase [Bacteroidales bacterium]